MEEKGELLRTEAPVSQPLFGNFEAYFSRDLRDSAQKMTYAYCLFYCFENAVRNLVSQRLLERKGANWWEDAVPSNVRKRVDNKKTEIENNKWHQATIGADINHTLFGDLSSIIIAQWQEFEVRWTPSFGQKIGRP
ncbi:MAG TPA: hypothetical protein VHD76_13265 [Bryobacteraceae bacterium]|jgi:hypothetical protein|nr:hypothetical protein [Bryobacteraceae bacterium]